MITRRKFLQTGLNAILVFPFIGFFEESEAKCTKMKRYVADGIIIDKEKEERYMDPMDQLRSKYDPLIKLDPVRLRWPSRYHVEIKFQDRIANIEDSTLYRQVNINSTVQVIYDGCYTYELDKKTNMNIPVLENYKIIEVKVK